MVRIFDGLQTGRVIGDVVDWFLPTIIMSVCFGDMVVTNGCDIIPIIAASLPLVKITGLSSDLFTLVMIDPDAPNPNDPCMREYVHWLVTDIPGCTDSSLGKEILDYIGPNPILGIHRYTFILFKQNHPLGSLNPPTFRSNFSTRAFAESLGFGAPVAALYFNAQRLPANKRRRVT